MFVLLCCLLACVLAHTCIFVCGSASRSRAHRVRWQVVSRVLRGGCALPRESTEAGGTFSPESTETGGMPFRETTEAGDTFSLEPTEADGMLARESAEAGARLARDK